MNLINLYVCTCNIKVWLFFLPPLFTRESDAAQSRSVVAVYAGHYCLHRRCNSSVIQQQQKAPVWHIYLAE